MNAVFYSHTMEDNIQLKGFVKLSVLLIFAGVSSVDAISATGDDDDFKIVKGQEHMADDVLKQREANRGYPDRCRSGK